MPKLKTHRGAAKRMKKTSSGKLRRKHAYASHILSKKSRKRKRNLRRGALVSKADLKKTRALLGYLVATERSHHRARLCSLLWDVTDDPRAALRWSLSKLRPLVDEEDHARIFSDGQTVGFRSEGAYVDVHELQKVRTEGPEAATTEALIELADSFTGDVLEGLDLGDFHEFSAWCAAVNLSAASFDITIQNPSVEYEHDDAHGLTA